RKMEKERQSLLPAGVLWLKLKSFLLTHQAVSSNKLQELRIILLGQKTVGKSATGNTLLHKEVFASSQNEQCQMQEGEVAGRRVTVIDTLGWWQDSSCCTDDIDKEIARGFSLSPVGVHVILLVIPLDLTFRDPQRMSVGEHMKLLGEWVWRYTMVLFTCGDYLGEKTIEQHIKSEGEALKWLIEKCLNRYQVFNNRDESNLSQVTKLLQKIEEMVCYNGGSYYKVEEHIFRVIKENSGKYPPHESLVK
uniref:AIG1-type G domain-containing protein n=1 Tax=Oreochromis niloticus TaxID=8128 RepID=A0A669BBU8_ORENI